MSSQPAPLFCFDDYLQHEVLRDWSWTIPAAAGLAATPVRQCLVWADSKLICYEKTFFDQTEATIRNHLPWPYQPHSTKIHWEDSLELFEMTLLPTDQSGAFAEAVSFVANGPLRNQTDHDSQVFSTLRNPEEAALVQLRNELSERAMI